MRYDTPRSRSYKNDKNVRARTARTLLAAAAILALVCGCRSDMREIMAVTGATPWAYNVDSPAGFTLTVDGMVKKKYLFEGKSLNALPSRWVRTREISPTGEFTGTYAYTGVSLIAILDGVAPQKPKNAAFDRPLDMLVTFTSSDGKKARFSYGELTMVEDSLPVMLAFDRRQVLPTNEKTKKTYDKNRHTEKLKGLRLVCPADPDTSRYLDNVVKMTLGEPRISAEGLPAMKKGTKCSSTGITGHWKDKSSPFVLAGLPRGETREWVRVGHGQGFKGISSAGGVELREALKKNFPGCGESNYFLFVACDGYRVLFSGREIFLHESGRSMMILDTLDDKPTPNGPMLGPLKDYFVDRDIWGLSHIVVIDGID